MEALIEDALFIRNQGHTWEQVAQRLGVTLGKLEKVMIRHGE